MTGSAVSITERYGCIRFCLQLLHHQMVQINQCRLHGGMGFFFFWGGGWPHRHTFFRPYLLWNFQKKLPRRANFQVGIIFFDNSITPLIEIQTMAFQKLLTTHENASLKGKIDDSWFNFCDRLRKGLCLEWQLHHVRTNMMQLLSDSACFWIENPRRNRLVLNGS